MTTVDYSDNDRQFFEKNPHAAFRIRKPMAGEWPMYPNLPRNVYVLIEKIAPNMRTRKLITRPTTSYIKGGRS